MFLVQKDLTGAHDIQANNQILKYVLFAVSKGKHIKYHSFLYKLNVISIDKSLWHKAKEHKTVWLYENTQFHTIPACNIYS